MELKQSPSLRQITKKIPDVYETLFIERKLTDDRVL
jgi:hypothetical protein